MSTRMLEARSPGPQPIDPRIAERRDSVARDQDRRRRRRLLWIAIVLVVVCGLWLLTRSPVLDVDRIDVRGNEQTTTEEILTATGVRPGDQLLDVDAGRARRALLDLPWVADASVRVAWPDTVRVSVTEREPVAIARVEGGSGMLIDGEGRALAPATGSEPPPDAGGLPVMTGLPPVEPGEDLDPRVHDALALSALIPTEVRPRVMAIVVQPDGQLELQLRPMAVVRLGSPTDLESKVASLTTVLAQVDGSALAGIDVLVPDIPVVHRFPPPTGASAPGQPVRSGG